MMERDTNPAAGWRADPKSYTVTVTAEGDLALPADLRTRHDINPGDDLDVREEQDGTLTLTVRRRRFLDLRGIVKPTVPVTAADLDRWIDEGRACGLAGEPDADDGEG